MNFADLMGMVLRVSGQASVLVVMVLAIQWMLSSRIPASWRNAFWLPVVLRLCLPVAPESRFSLFNVFSPKTPPQQHFQINVHPMTARVTPRPVADEPIVPLPEKHLVWKPSAMDMAGGIWLAVALILMLRAIFAHWKFGKMLSKCPSIRDEPVCSIFEKAREDLCVTQKLVLLEYPMMGSPALFGAIRPRLLLPPGLTEKFDAKELRHIFLHELAHVKRRDLHVNWMLVTVQALHWFNPLVWFACKRMRADRELACDVMALNCALESAPSEFGETMLKVLETFQSSRPLLGTISVVRNAPELKRRIRMIATYRPIRQSALLWFVLLCGICVAGLSDARTERDNSASQQASALKQDSPAGVVGQSEKKLSDLPSLSKMQTLLKSITLDEFSVPVETPLTKVLNSLSESVKEHDPKKRGINFMSATLASTPRDPNDPNSTVDCEIKIDPPLKNARLMDILEAIKNGVVVSKTGTSEWRLNYSIEDYGVVFFSSRIAEYTPLYTRTFKLNPTQLQNLLKAIQNNRFHHETVPSGELLQAEIKEYFAGVGLHIPETSSKTTSTHKALFLNREAGLLLVRATPGELDMVEDLVGQMDVNQPVRQVKLVLRQPETKNGVLRSAVESVSDAVASFSHSPIRWKTNATEKSVPVITAVVNEATSKGLFKALEIRRAYDTITTREATLPSGSEAVISISTDPEPAENQVDLHLIATVLHGNTIILSVESSITDSGRFDPQGNSIAVNAVGYVTKKISAVVQSNSGDTIIFSVPRDFRDGKDFLLFITPEIQAIGGKPPQ